eukprot:gnl/MRDRNA2_/MRDRNA2_26839_c0_seq1.p1 gnl/MRDRNA2_/MRDRNA2_26839_c0~~gnl/MRDRNA2_/MRDRNA2_26839_c0_seq1.p1  ORF type:complete len:584 (-),score=50.74 gnl/MRDRNA2_/MRDRNA2_26839_c0_seq1:287-2038(-)
MRSVVLLILLSVDVQTYDTKIGNAVVAKNQRSRHFLQARLAQPSPAHSAISVQQSIFRLPGLAADPRPGGPNRAQAREGVARRKEKDVTAHTVSCQYNSTSLEAILVGVVAVQYAFQVAAVIAAHETKLGKATATPRSSESREWATDRIDRRVSIQKSSEKGRCLFTKDAIRSGEVVFVEKPIFVVRPSVAPVLWEALHKLDNNQKLEPGLNLHFAALASLFHLEKPAIQSILDKYVPDRDKEPGEGVMRVLAQLPGALQEHEAMYPRIWALSPHILQRLVSAWRINGFAYRDADALVMYDRISMCSHSCDPNCRTWGTGDIHSNFVVRARRNLSKNEEITITYLSEDDLLKGSLFRQRKLRSWNFTCACERCNQTSDHGRGFRCPKCGTGVLYVSAGNEIRACQMCGKSPKRNEAADFLRLEERYSSYIDDLQGLSQQAQAGDLDIYRLYRHYQVASNIFYNHWILSALDKTLWHANKVNNTPVAIKHLRRFLDFHETYYCRPTLVRARCKELLGDALQAQFEKNKTLVIEAFRSAHEMSTILYGPYGEYTTHLEGKLRQANVSSQVQAPKSFFGRIFSWCR